ncbi:MAG TPA: UvrD-helicase domain-containing protein, partial [Acidimicrobiales bacterium]|nr:UvrD-helicase domain-containing protein [Acidimicrobiales bacterium]
MSTFAVDDVGHGPRGGAGGPDDGADPADDTEARKRIAAELDTSLVVVAGAGTGKTTALVGRILELVKTGTPLRELAAITFTEAAAAELRARLGQALADGADKGPDPGGRMAGAIEELDEAAICTLHAFAQRLLLEHCVSVGLPPGFEVLDEVTDLTEFAQRWNRFADALFDDPAAEPTLVRAFALGLQPRDLEDVAAELHANWDHLDDLGDGPDATAAAAEAARGLPAVDGSEVAAAAARALSAASWCRDEDDKLLAHLRGVVAGAHRRLVAAGSDEQAVLQALLSVRSLACRFGAKDNWDGRVDEVRALCNDAEAARVAVLEGARASVVDSLVAHLARFTLQAAAGRRRDGHVTFHDLLVLARRLLRTDPAAAASLARRYRRILIDEFQDSDPIQIELAARLAASVVGDADLATARPGGLFVVGDPKQAVYRFRRADIETFGRVVDEIGDTALLRTNFRSVPGILDYVNAVFAELLGPGGPGQAAHIDLLADRAPLPGVAPPVGARGKGGRDKGRGQAGDATGPAGAPPTEQLAFDLGPAAAPASAAGVGPAAGPAPVVVLGGRLELSAAEVRRAAARDGARALRDLVDARWPVGDTGAAGGTRPARWGDIAVLIPTRTSLPPLSEAFDELDVPYRLEGSELLWVSDEVRDALSVLRAADDPADAVAVVGALRTAGLACGDDDLVTWHRAGGRWDPRAGAPSGLGDHPVAQAMEVVRALHRARWWSEPSAMVMAALEVTNAHALALAYRRPRDRWHRLRWLVDQARRFDETTGGTLRGFLRWADTQAEGDRRGVAIGPPDPDDDAVRVMTIHGAKGLEFPVVLVTGLERDGMSWPRAPRVLWSGSGGRLEVGFGRDIATPGYTDALAREKDLDAMEQVRLLYVAMTRARDHLLLCAHHGSTRSGLAEASHGARLCELGTGIPGRWRTLALSPDAGPPPGPPAAVRSGTDAEVAASAWSAERARWQADREARLSVLRRLPVATATAVAEATRTTGDGAGGGGAGEADHGRPDVADARWRQGDEPLLMGRAVHAVLAAVDLDSGADDAGHGIAEVALLRTRALGIEGRAGEVAAMAGRALDAGAVRVAARSPHHKELYVATPLASGGVFEGFVDLLVETGEGLVVVDYKTDWIGRAPDP